MLTNLSWISRTCAAALVVAASAVSVHGCSSEKVPEAGFSCAFTDSGCGACAAVETLLETGNCSELPAGEDADHEGPFVEVVVAGEGACGRRENGTVECWGARRNLVDVLDLQLPGTFLSISNTTGDVICGVRTAGNIECWTNTGGKLKCTHVPPGSNYVQVAVASWDEICGLQDDGDLLCVRCHDREECVVAQLEGTYESLSRARGVCAIDAQGEAGCDGWGCYAQDPEKRAPESPISGSFLEISTHQGDGCGIRTDGSLECWGWGCSELVATPAGKFKRLSTLACTACALSTEGAVTCWGDGELAALEPPEGVFTDVSLGDTLACGVLEDGSVSCWGDKLTDPPSVF